MKNHEREQAEVGSNGRIKPISQRGNLLLRMKVILSLVAAFFCFPLAQAEVIIYKHSITITDRTDAVQDKMKFSGWTVIDLQTGRLGIIRVLGSSFGITQPPSGIASITRAENAPAVGIISVTNGLFSGLIATGKNKSVDIGTSQNWNIPRTLVVTGSQLTFGEPVFPQTNSGPAGPAIAASIFPTIGAEEPSNQENPGGFFPGPLVQTNSFNLNSTEQKLFTQFSGNLIYDRVKTVQANSQNWDFAATLLHFENLFQEKNYIALDDDDEELELILHESLK